MQKWISITSECVDWRCLPMNNDTYSCPEGIFHSYLKYVIADFVAYKVSCGYLDISFIPKLKLFDNYCMEHPADEPCLNRETVMGFLQRRADEKSSNLRNKSKVIRSLGKYMVSVKRMKDVYIVPFQKRNGKDTYIPYVFSVREMSAILHHAQTYTASAMEKLPNISNANACISPCYIARVCEYRKYWIFEWGILILRHVSSTSTMRRMGTRGWSRYPTRS